MTYERGYTTTSRAHYHFIKSYLWSESDWPPPALSPETLPLPLKIPALTGSLCIILDRSLPFNLYTTPPTPDAGTGTKEGNVSVDLRPVLMLVPKPTLPVRKGQRDYHVLVTCEDTFSSQYRHTVQIHIHPPTHTPTDSISTLGHSLTLSDML